MSRLAVLLLLVVTALLLLPAGLFACPDEDCDDSAGDLCSDLGCASCLCCLRLSARTVGSLLPDRPDATDRLLSPDSPLVRPPFSRSILHVPKHASAI